jgi:hypothetical protein
LQLGLKEEFNSFFFVPVPIVPPKLYFFFSMLAFNLLRFSVIKQVCSPIFKVIIKFTVFDGNVKLLSRFRQFLQLAIFFMRAIFILIARIIL